MSNPRLVVRSKFRQVELPAERPDDRGQEFAPLSGPAYRATLTADDVREMCRHVARPTFNRWIGFGFGALLGVILIVLDSRTNWNGAALGAVGSLAAFAVVCKVQASVRQRRHTLHESTMIYGADGVTCESAHQRTWYAWEGLQSAIVVTSHVFISTGVAPTCPCLVFKRSGFTDDHEFDRFADLAIERTGGKRVER